MCIHLFVMNYNIHSRRENFNTIKNQRQKTFAVPLSLYVTGPEKTGLIYTKYTYSYYGAYLFFRVCYPNSVSFIEFLRIYAYIKKFVLKCYVAKMRYCILKTKI